MAGFHPSTLLYQNQKKRLRTMSLPAMPGTARIVAVRFRLGFSWFSWLQLLGRPWSACGCSLSLLCGWCTVTSGGAQPVSQSWRLFPACRRGYIHRVSAAWFVHACGARVRAARITWAGRPSFATRRRGCACCGRRFSRGSASSRRHRAVSPTVSVAAACPCAWLALGFWTIWRIGQFGVFGSAHRNLFGGRLDASAVAFPSISPK